MSNITDNPKIQVLKAGCSGIFTNYIYKAIPLAFDESMSYYETLAGLRAYLKDVILPTVNGNTEAVAELQELYIQLNDYVTNYFDNLDVQEEINNKLDEMVEDGTIESILLNYSQVTKVFDTYNDMMLDTSTYVNGMKLKTLGYRYINDGGGADYVVTSVQSDTKYQVSIGTNLWIEMIIKDSVNVKQFGAYGDGVTDDSQSFITALNVIKNTNCKKLIIPYGCFIVNDTQLVLPDNIILTGYGPEKSIIQFNSLNNEIFIRNEHYLNYDFQDSFIIENLRINKNSTQTISKRCMRFACTKNVIIRNVILYSDIDSQFGGIDMYSYNENLVIENCKIYKYNSTAGLRNGGFAIREISPTHTTKNIVLRDCYIEKDGKDEALWIDGWKGTVKDVLLDNFTLIDNSEADSANSVWIGGNDMDSICENVTVINSHFYKKGLLYRLIAIGDSEVSNSTCVAKNINIFNCTFTCDTIVGTSPYISFINTGRYLIDEGCTIKNNIFQNNDTENPISCFIFGINNTPVYSINNQFNGKSQRSIYNILSSKDDLFIVAPTITLYQNVANIDNVKCLETIPYLLIIQNNTTITDVIIKNCVDLTCAKVFQNNNNTYGINYLIINCIIKNDNPLCTNYSQDTNLMSLTILNTDIKTNQLTAASNINLKTNGLSVNGEAFKGIPTNQYDRNNYPIGTVFFSNTNSKSIVRKITAGSATTDWEEI